MRFIDFIRDRARYYNCPVCGRSLRDCELRMLRQGEDRYTVQVTCSACQVQFIVILAVQGEGLEPIAQDELALDVELAEDGDAAEAAAAEPRREPIHPDEILDSHLLLKEFDGRLTDLFKQPSGDRH